MEKDGSVPIGRLLWIDKGSILVMMDGKEPVENRPENGDLKYTTREAKDEQADRCGCGETERDRLWV